MSLRVNEENFYYIKLWGHENITVIRCFHFRLILVSFISDEYLIAPGILSIAWLGHVMRMDDKRTPKRILEWKPTGTKIRGRPRNRCTADIEEDMQIMGIRRWRNQCKERAEWKRISEKAKTHSGL